MHTIIAAMLLAAMAVACGKKEDPQAANSRPQICVKAAIVEVYEDSGVKTTLLENVDDPNDNPRLRFHRRGLFGKQGETILLCEYN